LTGRAARVYLGQVRRLVILGATFSIALALVVRFAVDSAREDALQAAKPIFLPREAILERLRRDTAPGESFVAWLGDSTILATDTAGSYPHELGKRSADLSPFIAGHYGFEPFAYYFLMPTVLDRRPSAVVLIANPRLLDSSPTRPVIHLADLLPAEELPRAAFLPLHTRGWTMPRLLLARLMRSDWGSETAYFFTGLRELWHADPAWTFAGSTELPPGVAFATYGRAHDGLLREYDTPISEATPSIRMLATTVAMATERGVPALVVVTPIPWQLLEEKSWYRAERFAARMAAIERAVVANGGTFLDLHRRLDRSRLRDHGGHFNRAGTLEMADALEPVLRSLLASAPPAQSPL
jgi:hypothetical protein